MLDKTLSLLQAFKAGQYAAEDEECYDEEEIKALGALLSRLVYAPSKLRRRLQELGTTITRADFYSEIPTIDDIEKSFSQPSKLVLDQPFKDEEFLREFLQELTLYSRDFNPPMTPSHDAEFAWQRGAFSYSDAMAYYSMIRRFRPKTILELGCGTSTMVASLACEHNGMGRIIAVEPYPADYLSKIPRVELIQRRVQDIDLALFNDNLQDNDILFIDTTHTVRHDSDCLHIYLRLLPFIEHSIITHVHDIYLPDALPIQMMRDRQIFWNEQYLLYAYFVGNPRTKVLYSSAFHNTRNRAMLEEFMHQRYQPGGASIWFSQSGPVTSAAS